MLDDTPYVLVLLMGKMLETHRLPRLTVNVVIGYTPPPPIDCSYLVPQYQIMDKDTELTFVPFSAAFATCASSIGRSIPMAVLEPKIEV